MLENLKGRLWTREEELIADVGTETDYDVLGVFWDYMNVIDRTEDDGEEIEVKLVRAGSTIAIR